MTAGFTATAGRFIPEKPRPWANVSNSGPFDIAPDGKRLVVRVRTTADRRSPERTFVFVRNFFDELRRRVPLGQ